VSRHFPSIRHVTLRELLFHRLLDPGTQALIDRLLAAGGAVYQTPLAATVLGFGGPGWPPDRGLALGSYFSQWCGNFYLDGLDHFIKRELRVRAYLRYMDDLVLLADDRAALAELRSAIAAWLEQARGLTLNPKRWHVVPTAEATVFLGYRVSRAGITPSRKLRRRLPERLRRAAARGQEPLVRTLRSYAGLLLF
jgi:hypothetical protein